jgi:hypothetical protein
MSLERIKFDTGILKTRFTYIQYSREKKDRKPKAEKCIPLRKKNSISYKETLIETGLLVSIIWAYG